MRLQTDASVGPTKCLDYAPFGELLSGRFGRSAACFGAATQANQTMFTGQYRDQETQGIDFFEARMYASAQGRFLSADAPLVDQDPSDPQSWNLYSYVRNNPLSNVDPNGASCVPLDANKPDGPQYDDQDGKGCDAAGVNPSPKGKAFDPTRDIQSHGITQEASMPDTLLTRGIDLASGAADSFAFGLGSAALKILGLYVNHARLIRWANGVRSQRKWP